MSAALEDIWNTPATNSPPRTRSTADDEGDGSPGPTTRRRATQPLFLDSDSDNDAPPARPPAAPSAPRTPSAAPEIDHFFAGLDDDDDELQPLAPALDVDALRRAADAKHAASARASALALTPHAILPSSSPPRDVDGPAERWKGAGDNDNDGGEKKRKVIAKMDVARLRGPDGFPALLKQTKEFKPKGKGHEQADLNRLLKIYQFWTHKMYPKGQFRDTVNTVEKLCHSKRMQVSLSVWRDESQGLVNGRPPPEDDPEDIPSDAEADADAAPARGARSSRSSSPARSSPTPASRPAPNAPSRPPTSGSEMGDDDDFDLDDMIREDEARAAAATRPAAAAAAAAATKAAVTVDDDDDFDLDEMIREDEARASTAARPAAPPAAASAAAGADEGMDDVEFWNELARGAGDEIDLTLDEPPPGAAKPPPPVVPLPGPSTIDIDDDLEMDEDAWQALAEMESQAAAKPPAPAAASAATVTLPGETVSADKTGQPASDRMMTEGEEWESMYVDA